MSALQKKYDISKENAAKELLRRRRARTSLIDFARYTMKGYVPSDHHFKIAEALERVIVGDIKRLMIEMPPRHGKSELASRRFPAYFLGKFSEREIIAASYNSELANDFGRDVRNLVGSHEYINVFQNVSLAKDSKAAGRWHTNHGGGYVSAGIGTAVTGRGAHILIIDDPFKDDKEASSELVRNNVYNWYLSTAYTRLEGSVNEQDHDDLWSDQIEALEDGAQPFEGAIVIINTRWHEDDLCGRLIEDQKRGADKWEVLSLPAIKNEGTDQEEALWPSKYPLERLKNIQKALSSRLWNALYQQNPTPDEGTFFKREWFKRFHLGDEPEHLNKYQADDYAVTDNKDSKDPDYSEFGIFGIDCESSVWITDWYHKQTTSDVWIDAKLDQVKKHEILASFGEGGVIRRAVEPYLKKQKRKRGINYRQEWINKPNSKVVCARAFQGMAASGMINIPYGDWGDRLIHQLCSFPNGKHDDGVDVCSTFGMALDQGHDAIIPIEEKAPDHDLDRWGRNRIDSESLWKTM